MNPGAAAAPAAQGGGGLLVPFHRASKQIAEAFFTDVVAVTANQQPQQPHGITPGGFLRGVVLIVTAAGGVLGPGVARPDYPFNTIASITLEDVGGNAIIGPLTGYELYIVNKYGGYAYAADPETLPQFTTGINPTFQLWVPCEIRSDGLGSLVNTDSRSQYRINYTVESSGNIYSTLPTTAPTLTIVGYAEQWSQAEAANLQGMPQEQVPPGITSQAQSTQFWKHENPVVAAGAQTVRVTNVGNLFRTLIAIVKDNTGPPAARADNLTDPIRLRLDRIYLRQESPAVRFFRMARHFNLTNGPTAASLGVNFPSGGESIRDTGVYVWTFASGIDGHPSPGDEGDWLETNEGTLLVLEDSLGGAGTLTWLINDVALAA